MDRIRVGFVGAGAHSGGKLYPALRRAGLELVAVCARHVETARVRAAEYHVERYYADHREMCERERLDAVLVCVGPQAHYEIGLDLLRRGYHVWTEKPCAQTSAQAEELAAAAAEAGRVYQVGFNYRYTHGILKVKDLIAAGRFAPPALVAVRWWLGQPDSDNFLHHYAVHAVDLLHHLVPGELRDRQVAHHRQDGFDYVVATFRGQGGVIGLLELSANMNINGHWSQVELLGKDGMLSVKDFTRVTHYRTAPWGRFAPAGAPLYDGDHVWSTESVYTKGSLVETWGYVAELDRFRRAVLGEQPPECTIQEAAWGLRVCEQLMSEGGSTRPPL